jgi:hypothetical protein
VAASYIAIPVFAALLRATSYSIVQSSASGSTYKQTLADAPAFNHRLDEASSTTAGDTSGNNGSATYQSGVGLGGSSFPE